MVTVDFSVSELESSGTVVELLSKEVGGGWLEEEQFGGGVSSDLSADSLVEGEEVLVVADVGEQKFVD